MADWSEIVKLAVRGRYSFAIWVTSALILVGADTFPEFLQLGKFRDSCGPYLGGVCLLSIVVWIVEMALLLNDKVIQFRRRRATLEHLDSLSREEMFSLALAISKNTRTIELDAESGSADSLVAKRLLEAIPSENRLFRPFTVPRFVWRYLMKPARRRAFIAAAKERLPEQAGRLE